MSRKKFKSWWVLLFRGILITFFGIMILLRAMSGIDDPEGALIKLSMYFGWIIFTVGIINIAGAVSQGGPKDDWNWLLSEGMLDLMIGGIIMIYPLLTGPIVLLVIAMWGLISSVVQIVSAIINRKRLRNWWVTVINGVIMLLLVYLYLTGDLSDSALMIFALLGSSMCVLGLMYIVLSFSAKGMTPKEVNKMRQEASDLSANMKGIS